MKLRHLLEHMDMEKKREQEAQVVPAEPIVDVNAELRERQRAKDEKEQQALDKIEAAINFMKRKAAKIEAAKVSPLDMFRDSDNFSEFDEETGLPTKMKDGSDAPLLLTKKLRKQQRQHEKLHAEYLLERTMQMEVEKHERLTRDAEA